jgi:hypothetical protein
VATYTYGISSNYFIEHPVELPGMNPGDGYGVHRDKAINPVDGYGADYVTFIEFQPPPGIRGYEVWGSTDGQKFLKTSTRAFTQPWEYPVNHIDYSPEVVENAEYYYKLRAFNGNAANGGYTQWSDTFTVKPMPAFVSELVSPPHNSVSNKLWPTFSFKVSEPALLKAQMSDEFYFTLYLKTMVDLSPIFNVNFAINWKRTDEKGNPAVFFGDRNLMRWTSVFYDATDASGNSIRRPFAYFNDDGAITIETDNYLFQYAAYDPDSWMSYLLPGDTFAWTIFGGEGGIARYGQAANPTFFVKEGPVPPGSSATNTAYSLGSSLKYGYSAPNGLFTLTISPDAK